MKFNFKGRYFIISLYALGVLVAYTLFSSLLDNMPVFLGYLGNFMGILTPVIYGFVLAFILKALHFAGYEVSMSDANGAGLPELGNSTSPAVAQTVDGVRYDTRKAESLCSNKVVMFEDFYVELFEDAAGNYFTVLYQLSGCQHHTITPVSARAAKQFLERFGSRA